MITEKMIRMMSKDGFTEVFWEHLKQQRVTNPKATYIECYEEIEQEYIACFGKRRYTNFQSFRRHWQ